ncbi:hypothetical protein EMPS_11497 [Entomortierella parvispora]|uniref:Uncharacterized protein n=1 Tax=Entomortierella parvispora TaxID=205924 RepID=A0A9P3HMJ8_9FUNG|nr:hypothetical protein EMPS_11497 [Entomortierella parvispora]
MLYFSKDARIKEDPRVRIHRILLLFSLALFAFDIYNVVQATHLACFTVLDPLLQGFATLVPDFALALVYLAQLKRHAQNRQELAAQKKPYFWFSFGNILWRLVLLAVFWFWPFKEMAMTREITYQSLEYNNCSTGSEIESVDGRSVIVSFGGLTVAKDLIPFLKVTRVRTSIGFAMGALMLVEMALSVVARFSKVRVELRKAKDLKAAAQSERALEEAASSAAVTGADITRSSSTVVDNIELGSRRV